MQHLFEKSFSPQASWISNDNAYLDFDDKLSLNEKVSGGFDDQGGGCLNENLSLDDIKPAIDFDLVSETSKILALTKSTLSLKGEDMNEQSHQTQQSNRQAPFRIKVSANKNLKIHSFIKAGFIFHRFLDITNKWIWRILEFRKKNP